MLHDLNYTWNLRNIKFIEAENKMVVIKNRARRKWDNGQRVDSSL
jgi:hypothetical protein